MDTFVCIPVFKTAKEYHVLSLLILTALLFFHLPCVFTAGDVLHGSPGHKDALETDGFPSGKAFSSPSRSVNQTAGKHTATFHPRKANKSLHTLKFISGG